MWDAARQRLLFSDPNENTIYEYTKDGRLSVFRTPSGYSGDDIAEYKQPGSNGLALDRQGRLTINEHGNRRVVRYEPSGALTVIATTTIGWVVISVVLCTFVIAVIGNHFWAQARHAASVRETGVWEEGRRLFVRDPGYWGGQVSHVGVAVLALAVFAMGTSEFMLAGLVPDIAADLGVDLGATGLRETAGWMAAELADNPSERMLMIAVTGTNGKTSTVQLLAQALGSTKLLGGRLHSAHHPVEEAKKVRRSGQLVRLADGKVDVVSVADAGVGWGTDTGAEVDACGDRLARAIRGAEDAVGSELGLPLARG